MPTLYRNQNQQNDLRYCYLTYIYIYVTVTEAVYTTYAEHTLQEHIKEPIDGFTVAPWHRGREVGRPPPLGGAGSCR